MNASNNERYIPWFNPREMADSTVTALAIGREKLLQDFITVIRQRLESPVKPTAGAHWLVTGQRGAGKSFFLRYAQIKIPQAFPDSRVRFVLLPEELRNVRAPHNLLDEIRRMLVVAQGDQGRAATWRTENPENAWKVSLEKLLAAFSESLLVVGIENFAQLFDKVFTDDVAASLLRKLMEHEPRILLLATAVDGSFDDDYGNRFYHQFEKRPLPNWDSQAHRKYLEERARLTDRTPTPEQLARIDAYSRYTGGNARIAAILAAAILDEQDIVDASNDLNATIDKISDYYRALLDALPKNSEILFDALIRGGEPCSQTQLAERVDARQSDISQAFAKLLEIGYLHAHRPKGQKETRYQVADRLFAEWYRMRYLDPGQRSRLAVMADLLTDILTFREKLRYAERFSAQGEHDDAQLMIELAHRECGIDIKPLRAAGWGNVPLFLDESYKQWPKTNFEIVRAAICAAEWLHRFREGNELAPQTFKGLWESTIETVKNHGWQDESLLILNLLFKALPDTESCALERADLLVCQSYVFSAQERPEQALQSAQKALALIADQATSTKLNRVRAAVFSYRIGLAFGMLNRWSEALAIHWKILPLLIENDDKPWHTGQAARYLWRLEGLASAWNLIIDQNLEKDDLACCIGQLGDGVCDTQRVDGVPQAYAAGRELLTGLIKCANDPTWADTLLLEKTVRVLFINMLNTGLDLPVLQDLAQDLPSFAPATDELKPLAEMLYRWFGELRNPSAADKNTLPPDPDWATTIAALNEELTFEARLRLGLTETPRLSPEAANVFMRILAFIK